MVQRIFLAASLACILAACSPPAQQGESGAASNNTAIAGGLQPGQYRTTVTMLELSIPGMSSQPINTAPTVTESCVTSSDIADFAQNGMNNGDSGSTCTQNSMNTAGGRIQGESTCTGPEGTRTVRMDGTYSANRMDMEISSSSDVPGAGVSTMRMRMASERIGDCPAGSETD